MVSGLAICLKEPPLEVTKLSSAKCPRGPHPKTSTLLPRHLSYVGCCKSSPCDTVDCCLGGFTEGIVYNDSQNLKGHMDVR